MSGNGTLIPPMFSYIIEAEPFGTVSFLWADTVSDPDPNLMDPVSDPNPDPTLTFRSLILVIHFSWTAPKRQGGGQS
jgi:hypothetical protein